MKLSEHWLRTFVNPALDTRGLADALTFGGIEVEEISPAAPAFDRVVVGEVVSVEKHPNADRLSVCDVNIGNEKLRIVCGAPNVARGMKVPTALVGARLPTLAIKATTMRGVESHGMLCSEKELGLSAEAAGLMSLPADAEIGADVRAVLDLNDTVFTTKPTPNRGDCLSVYGLAREVAAITGAKLARPDVSPVAARIDDIKPATLDAAQACPLYCGRIVRDVNARAVTPQWIKARLERSGVRSISAIVDITNYVMLELGQPLHAFDAAKLGGGIHVRFARTGEKLKLLNGETITLAADHLVIADEEKPVALAGIMGGADTGVSDETRDIFLESAFFAPDAIAGKARALGFVSDSSFRFERGVDFAGTQRALDRATALVLEICGGRAGPIAEAIATLPRREPVRLRLDRATRVLGIELRKSEASDILRRLDFSFEERDGVFTVTPPAYRFDVAIEEDLIEELVRLHGYDKVPAAEPLARTSMLPAPESMRTREALRDVLVEREYHEVVTYSFVDRTWEQDFAGNSHPIALANPIASQMSVMRSNLIGGLVNCIAFNVRHKQPRVRVFEIGRCFARIGENYAQPVRIGAAAYGDAVPLQWATRGRVVDFFDVKGDLEALLAPRAARFEAAPHAAFHPGKSARIVVGAQAIGWIGELHPRWQQQYELASAPVLFEVDFDAVSRMPLPAYAEIAKVPPVRRDMAALFDENVQHQAILDALTAEKSPIVADVRLFDVYRGQDLPKGRKSLAFSVLLQDTRKTLTDAEVDSAVSGLREILRRRFNATLRKQGTKRTT